MNYTMRKNRILLIITIIKTKRINNSLPWQTKREDTNQLTNQRKGKNKIERIIILSREKKKKKMTYR